MKTQNLASRAGSYSGRDAISSAGSQRGCGSSRFRGGLGAAAGLVLQVGLGFDYVFCQGQYRPGFAVLHRGVQLLVTNSAAVRV